MAITLASTTGFIANPTNDNVVDLTLGTETVDWNPGDLAIAVFLAHGASPRTWPNITGWTGLTQYDSTLNPNFCTRAYYRVLQTGDTVVSADAGGSGLPGGAVTIFTGVDATTPLDGVTPTNNRSNGTTITAPSITTATNNAAVFRIFCISDYETGVGGADTISAGTVIFDGDEGSLIGSDASMAQSYAIQATAGASGTVTAQSLVGGDAWVTYSIALRAAAASETVTLTSATTYAHTETCILTVEDLDDTYEVWWSPSNSDPEATGAVQLTVTDESLTGGAGTIDVTANRGIVRYNDTGYIWLVKGSATDFVSATLNFETGKDGVVLAAPLADSGDRITAVADLADTDMLIWWNVQPSGSVTVYDDASFDADPEVTHFSVEVHVAGDGYGDSAVQSLVNLELSAATMTFTGTDLSILSLLALLLEPGTLTFEGTTLSISPNTDARTPLEWISQQDGVSGSYNDKWMIYLANEGYPAGSLNDRMMLWLGDLGYIGSLSDRFNAWIRDTLFI